jgi:hypothetical protein
MCRVCLEVLDSKLGGGIMPAKGEGCDEFILEKKDSISPRNLQKRRLPFSFHGIKIIFR